ncbi:unnamed protein product [Echinostoma caproni]|uniref:Uncharacterized protein n=1 Tax=Echinostoma caproni TaxID=27848 RepID=A0A183B622_9TREM|nr:unnamed protein product [Echinostoma caproni]
MTKLGHFFSNLRARYGKRNATKTTADPKDNNPQNVNLLPTGEQLCDPDTPVKPVEVTNQCGEGNNIEPLTDAQGEQVVGLESEITGGSVTEEQPEVDKVKPNEQPEECEPTMMIPPREFESQSVTDEEPVKKCGENNFVADALSN